MPRVITTHDIPPTGDLRVPIGAIVTPSARETAAARGVRILELPEDQLSGLAPPEKTIAIGADHGGFRLKEQLKPMIEGAGLAIRDVGVHEEKPADYPDIAQQVAELVARGQRRRAASSSTVRASDRPSRRTKFRASGRRYAMIRLPPRIAGNTMILMCLRSARDS